MYWTSMRGENLDVLDPCENLDVLDPYENLDVLDPCERGEPGCTGPL